MNINELKAFMNENPKNLGAKNSIQNQLRDSGLHQFADVQGLEVSLLSKFSSNIVVGARIFTNALNHNLAIDQQHAKLPIPKEETDKPKKNLFDFEEIARNVLKFAGGAIKHAQNKGADDQALTSLFEQVRSGVLKGVAMAEKDLGGIMNDEIKTGIVSSRNAIEQGLQKLQNEILSQVAIPQTQQTQKVQISQQASYQRSDSGELSIHTRDGDKVNIRFENFDVFEVNSQTRVESNRQSIYQQPVVRPQSDATQGLVQLDIDAVTTVQSYDAAHSRDLPDKADQQGQTKANVPVTQIYQHFESSAFSFSITGQLGEDEVAAIGKLVTDANGLADEFFNGDIESAFKQALEFGFDEKELTGFALQLTRVEQSQSIQTYESVSHFSEDDPRGDPIKVVKPVAHYLDKMLDVIEQSSQTLQSTEQYENLINGLINQMGEVHTPDLISALQRFHSFNQRLIDDLPLNLNKQTAQETPT
ncbi:MAG: hypothetical protein ACJAUL_000088 [Paraglaciecola sp.]|jgi:hypothetical protein